MHELRQVQIGVGDVVTTDDPGGWLWGRRRMVRAMKPMEGGGPMACELRMDTEDGVVPLWVVASQLRRIDVRPSRGNQLAGAVWDPDWSRYGLGVAQRSLTEWLAVLGYRHRPTGEPGEGKPHEVVDDDGKVVFTGKVDAVWAWLRGEAGRAGLAPSRWEVPDAD